jgi:phosphoribosylanthranilate isomerase
VTRVKICGCRTPEDALAAAAAGADFVGMIFAESRRHVSTEEASEIVRALGAPLGEMEQPAPPALYRTDATDRRSWFEHGAAALERLLARKRPLTVGVFAAMALEEVNEIADETGIDLIQLSGDEPWSDCLVANRQVIKVVHVVAREGPQALLDRVEPGSAIAVMLDSAAAGAFGGTGQRLDWPTAAAIAADFPVWLAGGLTPDNVVAAIEAVAPWCVDVASGVETDGRPDPAKVRDFVARAKGR